MNLTYLSDRAYTINCQGDEKAYRFLTPFFYDISYGLILSSPTPKGLKETPKKAPPQLSSATVLSCLNFRSHSDQKKTCGAIKTQKKIKNKVGEPCMRDIAQMAKLVAFAICTWEKLGVARSPSRLENPIPPQKKK